MLSVDVVEALAVADVSQIVSSRSKASSKREAMREGDKKDSRPKMILPCCGQVIEGNCFGVKFNHGLHTQCLNKKGEGQEYCKTCQKNADCSATGKPPYGDIRTRVEYGVDYRDPKGKLTTPYANVVEKMGLNLEAAHQAAAELGWTIPAEQLVKRVAKRGRPSKSAAVSDTDSETSEAPKKRGRKPKAKKKGHTEEDQIASLVAEAYQETQTSGGDNIQILCNEAKKEAAEQAKAEKAAAKLAKASEKQAKKEAAEQAKAEKAAAKLAKAEPPLSLQRPLKSKPRRRQLSRQKLRKPPLSLQRPLKSKLRKRLLSRQKLIKPQLSSQKQLKSKLRKRLLSRQKLIKPPLSSQKQLRKKPRKRLLSRQRLIKPQLNSQKQLRKKPRKRLLSRQRLIKPQLSSQRPLKSKLRKR
jgi:hypothetical protein